MGATTTNGDAKPNPFAAKPGPQTTAATSSPFAAAFQQQQQPAQGQTPAANPFAAKAPSQPAFGNLLAQRGPSVFGSASSPSAPGIINSANSLITGSNSSVVPEPSNLPFGAFGQPSQVPSQAIASNPFGKPSSSAPAATQPPFNPFSKAPSGSQQQQSLPQATNGSFAQNGSNGNSNPFGLAAAQQFTPASVFGQTAQPAAGPFNPAAKAFVSTSATSSATPGNAPPLFAPPNAFSNGASKVLKSHATPFDKPKGLENGFGNTTATKSVHFDLGATKPEAQVKLTTNGTKNGNKQQKSAAAKTHFTTPQPGKFPAEPQSDYAKAIYAQLQKDKIRPPQWPAEAGNPAMRGTMETFRESYKKYRDRVRSSLIKVGLIDDPEVRKRLDEAIDFKGICEDMCPDFEKMSRIVQYDVKMAEKTEGSDGTMWASPPLMVKALARSAAGQEAPLPMDVRSVSSLKRTLNYLVDTVLGDDSRLPTTHNFLWDRTRAIRRDFVFHSTMSNDEMLEQVYCLENITRFHATALHLLSKKGYAAEDFSEQQEREQLGKALLSLMQAYDDCKDKEIVCQNEAEFRAYFILLNAHDPDFQQKVTEWGAELWYDSDEIQTALTLVETMQSIWDWRGPVKPAMPTTMALGSFTTFFRIVESPQVSYTMACLAEIHFVHVRRGILRNVTRAYSRIRDSPKDLTVAALNAMLRFDTDGEALHFVEVHGLEFSTGGEPHLLIDKMAHVSSPTVRQSFSQGLVERKRGRRSLPEVIHTTVFEEGEALSAIPATNGASNLFVEQSPAPVLAAAANNNNNNNNNNKGKAAEAPVPALAAPPAVLASPFAPKPPGASSASAVPSVFATPASTSSAPASIFAASNKQNGTSSHASQAPTAASLFQKITPNNTPLLPVSTTPAGSPAKASSPTEALSVLVQKARQTAPASSLFFQAASKPEAATQPTSSTSFSSLFPTAPAAASANRPISTEAITRSTPAPAPAHAPVSAIPTLRAVEAAEKRKRERADEPAALAKATGTMAQPSASVLPGQKISPRIPAPPPPVRTDPMGDFTKWFVLGDDGILEQFKEAFVEHLVRQTAEQFERDREERQRREEDERSWAEALQFKTYNLQVKFFYRWRQIARERALDRRAREARDQMKAYQAARRAERRATAEKSAAEERERAAEARRMNSKEVKFLEELGYYGDFGATSRKRKASAASEQSAGGTAVAAINGEADAADALLATGILHGVRDEHGAVARVVQEASSPPDESPDQPTPETKLRKRQSIEDGLSETVSRAKALVTRRARRSSLESLLDGGEGSVASGGSRGGSPSSITGSLSPDSALTRGSVIYYRRSVPGRHRAHSIYTRVPAKAVAAAVAEAATPPGKVTNFMRYSTSSNGNGNGNNSNNNSSNGNKRWSSPGVAQLGSPSPSQASAGSLLSQSLSQSLSQPQSQASSNVRSSYWRLRAMGLVQMPNKQYLHESLALPMLHEGRRFPGVGSYGLPPVPAWGDADKAGKNGTGDKERKRLLSGEQVTTEADSSSSPSTKKARTEDAAAADRVDLEETERVIREMRTMADAMDEGKDWFKTQTERMQKGESVFDA